MPQINRVRIINFSYNNHHRNIIDETFDFFQGENALLNLKNGGGKSVLVQLLMQPVIPKTKLMGWRMEDFFRGKKTPAYVMIEVEAGGPGGLFAHGYRDGEPDEPRPRERREQQHDQIFYVHLPLPGSESV